MMRAGLALLAMAAALPAQQRADVIYDEAKVPSYTLPDVLRSKDGKPVRNAKEWDARRKELLQLYATDVYGPSPAAGKKVTWTVESMDPQALGGKAVRKMVTLSIGDGPKAHMLLYLPAGAKKPAPVVLGLSFSPIQTVAADPGIPLEDEWVRGKKQPSAAASRGKSATQWQAEQILSHGYGLATIYYYDFEPDFDGGWKDGVRPAYFKAGQTEPDPHAWAAIAVWAWGLQRAMDYLETDRDVDAKHVAVFGHSRLGKAALWAGAQDPRFALVISNESGEGGAAIARRDYGERTKDLNTRFPHWFDADYRAFNDHEDLMPFDSHFLLALIAPRPLYVASAEEDRWSDPRGEFLGASHASRVYELLGKKGLGTDEMPGLHQPVQHTVGYHIRAGKHDVTAYDWEQYLKFADMNWGRQ